MQYDVVLSLGGCCATAMQLQRRGLRQKSYGLDWIGGRYNPAFIPMLAHGFRNRFLDFCRKENLQETEILALGGYIEKGYFETLYQTHLMHSFFDRTKDPEWYESSMKVLRRRLQRIFDDLGRAKTACLILATYYDFPQSFADELYSTLREVFPGVSLKLRVMMFGSKTGPYSVNIGNESLAIYKYQRDVCMYDMHKTSSEWAFMDEIVLTDARVVGLFQKVLFRLYKKAGKYFIKRGLTYP